jgi:hypothetical protein
MNNALAFSGFAPYVVLDEPVLEFGTARSGMAHATDPQKGLDAFGPYSARLSEKFHPRTVRIHPIASADDWDRLVERLEKLKSFNRIEEPSPYARIDYPGFDSVFRSRCDIRYDAPGLRIEPSEFAVALDAESAATGYRHIISVLEQSLNLLGKTGDNDVIALHLPKEVIERFRRFTPDFMPAEPVKKRRVDAKGRLRLPLEEIGQEGQGEGVEETLYHDLRRSVKVMCMRRGIACQLVTENFLKEDPSQPWAAKLWNISTSIFCKGGGIPWRVVTDENVAYCGIRFGITKNQSGQSILVGLGQVFNAAGELVALRAGQALKKSESRSEGGYYLDKDQARSLLAGALEDYQNVTGRLADRVIVHKSSPFKPDEIQGMEEAAAGVRELDLIFVKDRTGFRLMPDRGQPADRCTVLPTSNNSALVYTTGFVREYGKWQGKHIPSPYEIIRFKSNRSLVENARDLLRMTKMNWNTTLYYRGEPCTFTNAIEVIGMMKELKDNESLRQGIRYYI